MFSLNGLPGGMMEDMVAAFGVFLLSMVALTREWLWSREVALL